MKKLTPQSLVLAAHRLMIEIDKLAKSKEALELQKLEHAARALCGQLKAIEVLEAYTLSQAQKETEQKYTRYEDLPPLMPEDRDRLKQDLLKLLSPRDIDREGPKA